jgi:hypothetical protein
VDGVLTAAGRAVVWTANLNGEVLRLLAFDPASNRWAELPEDPLAPGISRVVVADGDSLLLLDHEVGSDPGGDPALRIAEYRFETRRWRRHPDVLSYPSGTYTLEGTFVLPVPGRPGASPELADEWDRIQNPPPGQEDFGTGASATALLTDGPSYWFRSSGWAWDATRAGWVEVPRLRAGGTVDGRLFASAGRHIVAFGGATGPRSDLRNDTWTWSPDVDSTPALVTVD